MLGATLFCCTLYMCFTIGSFKCMWCEGRECHGNQPVQVLCVYRAITTVLGSGLMELQQKIWQIIHTNHCCFTLDEIQARSSLYSECSDTSFIMRPSSLGGGRILRRTLSVRLSVRPVIVAMGNVFSSTASVTDVLFGTHWGHPYFSARTEGRISYGHLGRTNSCLLIFLFFSRVLPLELVLVIVKEQLWLNGEGDGILSRECNPGPFVQSLDFGIKLA